MSRSLPDSPGSLRKLILAGIVFNLLLPVTLSALQRQTSVSRPTETPANSPTPGPSPPVVDFQAIPDRESIGPDDRINLSLFITNKSSKPLINLKLNVDDLSFDLCTETSPCNEPQPVLLTSSLVGYRSFTGRVILKPKSGATAGTHKLLLSLEYTWNADKAEFLSAQSTTATISIRRRFEEETKGFPGGTAAFFYLLLPIIPAILSYQFFDGLRRGEGPRFPQFKTEYIVPAFFAAVVLSLVMLVAFKLDRGLDYSNPLVFMGVLLGSLIAGAVVPLIRWRRAVKQRRLWAFTTADSLETYLRKALLAPWSPPEFEWAKGKVDENEWNGMRLRQPDGAIVLGPKLQVSYPHKASQAEQSELRQLVEQLHIPDADRRKSSRKRLVDLVALKRLNLDFDERVTLDGTPFDGIIAIDEVQNWKRAGGYPSPLVPL